MQFADVKIQNDSVEGSGADRGTGVGRDRSLTATSAGDRDRERERQADPGRGRDRAAARPRSSSVSANLLAFGKSFLGVPDLPDSLSSASASTSREKQRDGRTEEEARSGPWTGRPSFETVALFYCRCSATITTSSEGSSSSGAGSGLGLGSGGGTGGLLGWSSGTVYVTTAFVCLSLSTLGLGLHQRKEMFRLTDIMRCDLTDLPSSTPSKGSGQGKGKELEISLTNGAILSIRPLLVEAASLRAVILLAKDHRDASSWAMVGT